MDRKLDGNPLGAVDGPWLGVELCAADGPKLGISDARTLGAEEGIELGATDGSPVQAKHATGHAFLTLTKP